MLSSGQKIVSESDDAFDFIELINQILGRLIYQHSIKEVVFTKIRNWFDHKWLNYSGKTVVPFESGGLAFATESLESVWREKISIPPFNPNRVIYSKFFKKQHTDNLKITKSIHTFRNSNDNIHNRISNYTSNGIVVWFSSHTKKNQIGSLMVYRVENEDVTTFYATLENLDGWKITKTKGIGLNELRAYVELS